MIYAGRNSILTLDLKALLQLGQRKGSDLCDLSKCVALCVIYLIQMSRDMRFPPMWYVRPAKAQTSLRIRAV